MAYIVPTRTETLEDRALQMALDAAHTYERLGSPEGELAMTTTRVKAEEYPKFRAFLGRVAQVGAAGERRAEVVVEVVMHRASRGLDLRQGLAGAGVADLGPGGVREIVDQRGVGGG